MNTKKIIVGLLVVITMATNVTALSSHAYDSRDINNDGSVDIMNVILINKCLIGICTGRSIPTNDTNKHNDACRITPPILQFYLNNENI